MALYLIVAYGFLSVIANVVTMAAGVAMYLGRGWGKPVAMLGIAISAVTYLILAAEPFELGGVLWQSDLQAAGGIVGVALLALLVMLSPSPSPRPAPGSGPAGISSWAWSRPGRTVVSLIQPGAKGLGLTLAAWSVAMLVGAVPSAYDGWSLLSGLPVSLPPASWQPLYGVVWAWLWAAAAVLQLGGGSGMLSGARRARAAARAGAVVGMLAAVAEVPFDLHATGGIQFGWVVLGLPLGHLLIEAGILYLLGTVIAPKASPSSA